MSSETRSSASSRRRPLKKAPISPCIECHRSCNVIVNRRRIHRRCYIVRDRRTRTNPHSHVKGAASKALMARESLTQKGYAYVPGFGCDFAAEFQQRMGEDLVASHAAGRTNVIGGGVLQYSMPSSDQPGGSSSVFAQHLRPRYHELVQRLVRYVGIDATNYHIQDEKLLVSKLHQGEQALHFDRDDDLPLMKSTYTIILYLTDHATSTAFPTFDQDQLAIPQYADENTIEPLNREAMQASYRDGMLNKSNYTTVRVRAGDMMIFNQACMHAGTKCDTLHDRMALFCVLTAQPQVQQDEFQMFRWIYVSHAFGADSRELAVAMYQDRHHNPLLHAIGKKPLDSMIKCLLRWNVALWHPKSNVRGSKRSKAEDRITWLPKAEHRDLENPRSEAEIKRLYVK